MSRWLIILGVVLVLTGLAWPWIQKIGLGRLPGDIVIQRPNFKFYFPLASSILISVVLSLVIWLFQKFFR